MEDQQTKKIFDPEEIDAEVLGKVKSLPRIDFDAFTALHISGQVKRLKKLKKRRTIFFDEETGYFLYLNPLYKQLHKCGEFIE